MIRVRAVTDGGRHGLPGAAGPARGPAGGPECRHWQAQSRDGHGDHWQLDLKSLPRRATCVAEAAPIMIINPKAPGPAAAAAAVAEVTVAARPAFRFSQRPLVATVGRARLSMALS